jgi:(2R)-sulfolactate sulfo-lyase subunit alpha
MAKIPHLLVHNRRDNVGVVVVENLTAGTDMLCVVTEDNSEFRGTLNQDVPIGHKVALKDLAVGDTVIKYGEDIGRIDRATSSAIPSCPSSRSAETRGPYVS